MKIQEFADSLEKTAMEFFGLSKEEIRTKISYGYQEFNISIDFLPVNDRFVVIDSVNYLSVYISCPSTDKLIVEGVSSSFKELSIKDVELDEALKIINENLGTKHCKFIFENLVK